MSPSSSLNSSVSQHLFVALLFLLAGGLSGGDGTAVPCDYSGVGAGFHTAEAGGVALGVTLLHAVPHQRWRRRRLLAAAGGEKLQHTVTFWYPSE